MLRFLTLFSALLAGCSTGVVQMDPGVYMLGSNGGFTENGAKADVYKEASAFCATKGGSVETVAIETRGPIPAVRPASAQLTFRCRAG